jgi:uncharacterized protein YndB with AHSA1/START domain
MRWWGPKGFKMIVGELDLRPGGIFLYGMQAPTAARCGASGCSAKSSSLNGWCLSVRFPTSAGLTRHPMAPTWPIEMLGTATFIDKGGKTLLVNRVVALNASSEERATFEGNFDSMTQGWGGTWDQLAAYLATLQA